MVIICRAEDGEVFKVNVGVQDIERMVSLEQFLSNETGVEREAVLAFLSDGRRLQTENIREFAGSQDQIIYVFNKQYLDLDPQEAIDALHVDPPLQPPIDETTVSTPPVRASHISTAYLRAAHMHLASAKHVVHAMQHQAGALRSSFGALDLRALSLGDAFEELGLAARREAGRQATLLAGVDADLALVSRVAVHPAFLSPVVRAALAAGERPRTLGDYVSSAKMRQVADTCARTHGDLQIRYTQAQEAMNRLSDGTNEIRVLTVDTRLLEEAEAVVIRCNDSFEKMTDAAGMLDSPASDANLLLAELRQLDKSLRDDLVFLANAKNTSTERLVTALHRISVLNDDVMRLPGAMSALQTSFQVKNSFSHIQRLHNMLYAYGSTVVEIARRKEFAAFFFQRAQGILEVMAKLTAAERKRRQVYRSELHGQLPFDLKGLDDPVPSVDFSPSGSVESAYPLGRADVEELLRLFDELEHLAQSFDADALAALRQTRAALDKAVAKMDSLESGFDRIAEKSLLSSSRLVTSRRRAQEADGHMSQELLQQLQETQQAKEAQDRRHKEERELLHAEVTRLRQSAAQTEASLADERARSVQLEQDLRVAQAQLESDAKARRAVEERHAQLVTSGEERQQALAAALAEATEQAKAAEHARHELLRVQTEFEDTRTLEARNAANIAALLREQTASLGKLEDARARGDDLAAQIAAARAECEDVRAALDDAGREKDRLLRAQASAHDRALRDHIAEADGDRAVLEHQFSELRARADDAARQLQDARGAADVAAADAAGLREELARVEQQLRDARAAERAVRDDLRAGRASASAYETRLDDSGRLLAQMLDVALAFRTTHLRALAAAQTIAAHPGAVSKTPPTMGDSVFSTGLSFTSPTLRRPFTGPVDDPEPIDPSDPAAALDQLRAYDHDAFLEAIQKTGSTIRKWQKQCKEYRERAKGKISFRNFTKGDLALFLPTRNSVSKPWAAFNVSFPHYFLQATGHLAEQLKTREWIVARITSITERIVDHKDATSNPYGLGDGIKYYMLEVEDWTQPAPSKRRASSKKAQPDVDGGNTALALAASIPLPAGPPEVTEEEATLAPSSHLFPFRGASPPARPSALSRLLAQAPPSAAEGAAAPAPEPRQDERSTPDPEPEQDMPVPASGPSVSDLAASRPLLENPAPSEGTPEPEPAPAPTSDPEPAPTSEPEPDADPVPAAPASSPTILAPSFVADEPAPSEYHDVPTSAPTPVPATLTLTLAPGAPPATMPRPMSRASRMSISSRFSPGKLPAFPVPGAALAKASPTTAISELPPIPADPFLESPTDTSTPGPLPPPAAHERARSGSRTPTLSPTGSMGEDMSRALLARRRTSSYHFPRTSPLAAATVTADATPAPSPLGAAAPSPSAGSGLAGLVGSWGFGRKRRSELAVPQDQRAVSASAATQADARTRKESQSRASELLRRF